MVKLLECPNHTEEEEFLVPIDQLHSMKDVDIRSADIAMRELQDTQLQGFIMSNPNKWPPVVVTWTDQGHVLVGGAHRAKAAELKGMKEIRAICKSFTSEIDLIRAAYGDNRRHGLPHSAESRSNYARWLHEQFPAMKQDEIAEEAGITQPTVSIALKRKPKKTKPKQPETPAPGPQLIQPEPEPSEEEKMRESARRDWQTITRDMRKLMEDTKELDEPMRRATMMEALGNIQDRDNLLALANLIREVLAPPPPAPTKRPPRKKP
jgi:ParB-like chromosome segregation protein Spo0J